MKLSELNFKLPESLIAQYPAHPADAARLMIIDKKKKTFGHDTFKNIDKYLKKGDLLVFNDSKVLPARLIGRKSTGGKMEVVLLRQVNANHWQTLVRYGNKAVGSKITFSKKLSGFIESQDLDIFTLHFNLSGKQFFDEVAKIGLLPTPPYIKRIVKSSEYQNVFANPKKMGSAAAPTAGLHFTKALLSKLKRKGIQIEFVTLHVGLGTFQPVRTDRVEDHEIHTEYYEVTQKTLNNIRKAKIEKRRIIAVGTTSCRVLETLAPTINTQSPTSYNVHRTLSGETNIFIYPGYKFKVIDALITNFHTPSSSLLALVMAMAGKETVKKAYQTAIDEKYRFYSLGDGMIIM